MNLLATTIQKIHPQDTPSRQRAHQRLLSLTMPTWSLGRVMDLAEDLCGMTHTCPPPVARKTIVLMAADHGVADSGVSQFPKEVTIQQVRNFVRGGASINALARLADAFLCIVDVGVDADLADLSPHDCFMARKIARGTANMEFGPAMTREQAIQALEIGIEVAQILSEKTDIYATGEMGIGNTTPSTAIISAITGHSLKDLTGPGSGLNPERVSHKLQVLETAMSLNQPDTSDAIDILAKVGGFEIGALAGLILGAASLHKPILVDGYISTAAALLAYQLCPASADYMIASHQSAEPGHRIALEYLKKQPFLQLNLRLGEGTGCALAMNLIDAAYKVITEITTFDEAGVSQGNA